MKMPDKEEVKRALALLFPPEETTELRCVGHRDTIGGYYRDQEKLAQDACLLNAEFEPKQNVYVCLNPINPQLFGRRADKFALLNKGEGVKDSDVICRRRLLIDLDPVRPAGVSATDAQKRAAFERAKQVWEFITSDLSFPEPIAADSGNGLHLVPLFADLPNDNVTKWACEQFLRLLGDRFSDGEVKIDQSTFNAARIGVLYGTVKRKGCDIPEQPHRLSKILYVPDPLVPVTLDQLLAIVGQYPGDQRTDPQSGNRLQLDMWNIEQLLRKRGIDFHRDEYQSDRGPAIRYVLPTCPWNADHTDSAAFIIQWPNGAIAAGCHHDGCKGKGNDWQALKKLWALPTGPGISSADIVLPATQPHIAPSIYAGRASPISTVTTPVAAMSTIVEPPSIRPEAFHGPIGGLVRELARDTEATAEAMLFAALLYFGNAIGRRYFVDLNGRHFPKIFVALVGPTARGRKGTADRNAQSIVDSINPAFALYRHSGLTTGEGMIQALLNNMEAGMPCPAVFIEPEFSAVLYRKERKGNTLGSYIRDAWDDGSLAVNTKNNPLRVDNSHVSLLVHITPSELVRLLPVTDFSSGFANRFLWCYTSRVHLVPDARSFIPNRYPKQVDMLRDAFRVLHERHIAGGGQPIELPLNPAAKAAWPDLYRALDPESDAEGLLVHLGARGAQQIRRVAAIFALADGLFDVGLDHIHAARAVFDYSLDSMDYTYSRAWWGEPGNAHDPAGMAPKLFAALKAGPMQRSEVSIRVFHKNFTSKELDGLRNLLACNGQLIVEPSGRSEIWRLPQTTP